MTGVKTGHTWKAGYVPGRLRRADGVQLISVAIDAPTDETRFSDDLELLEWGFRSTTGASRSSEGEELADRLRSGTRAANCRWAPPTR